MDLRVIFLILSGWAGFSEICRTTICNCGTLLMGGGSFVVLSAFEVVRYWLLMAFAAVPVGGATVCRQSAGGEKGRKAAFREGRGSARPAKT